MLKQISINNLGIVEALELDFSAGMSTLTGETGAGKSILIDALSLCLGERAEASLVRTGASSASITAVFEIDPHSPVASWLNEKSLFESEPQAKAECSLRRVISADGRSRAFINGQQVTVSEVRELGEFLVNIHGQHQHQALLKMDHQRALLDHYAQLEPLCEQVQKAYKELEQLKKSQETLLQLEGQEDRLALLEYQIQEFDELKLQINETQLLEQEHSKLSHAEQWLTLIMQILACLRREDQLDNNGESLGNAETSLHYALQHLNTLKHPFPTLSGCHELLNNALIHIEEAVGELLSFQQTVNLDPERLKEVDTRLGKIHTLARKHKIPPAQILEHRETLFQQAEKIKEAQFALRDIDGKIAAAKAHYGTLAETLSTERNKAAEQLSTLITQSLHSLEMQHGKLKIKVDRKSEEHFSPNGIDDIDIMVTTNPGQPLQPLRKVASGGEMSRISLAIQVITSKKMTIPTLIFDEVDVGISGKTAEIVGNLVRQLGEHAQVLCITHLPQVAAKAHHHYKVEKHQTDSSTTTQITYIKGKLRIKEIARMLGGITITQNTLAHAEEMLEG